MQQDVGQYLLIYLFRNVFLIIYILLYNIRQLLAIVFLPIVIFTTGVICFDLLNFCQNDRKFDSILVTLVFIGRLNLSH